jgi:putative transposase
LATDAKRRVIDSGHRRLSLRRQCELLGLARSSWFYDPVAESEENLALMRRIDEVYLDHPYFGSRRMVQWLKRDQISVNRKRVQRLMRLMGLEAIYPKPRTTKKDSEHRIFPYLLRGMTIERPDQVWCSDITYIPMVQGYLYLVAVMDWYSRYVLSWRLSNSLEGSFCVEALEEALGRGRPEIFNTDQGSQFTSASFVGVLESRGIQVSMDGKGRALDNVFVERLWRSLKYEEVYLKSYQDGREATTSLTTYLAFYCHARPHQGLGYKTPAEVYESGRNRPRRAKAGAVTCR